MRGASSINGKGEIVGIGTDYRMYLLSGGRRTDLGRLAGGVGNVLDLNDVGQVVGWAPDESNVSRAFIYQDGKLTDLNSLANKPSEWILAQATGINNKGVIVGYGYNGTNTEHAFVLKPIRHSP